MRFKSIMVLVLTVLVGLVVPVSPAQADDLDDRGLQLVQQAANGRITEAELAELIEEYPRLAERVPQSWISGRITVEIDPWAVMAPLASCATVYGTHTEMSITGLTTLYVFRHYVRFCWNGSTVTSVVKQPHTMSNLDWTIGGWSVQQQITSGVNTSQARSYLQLRVEHCFPPAGCVGFSYPWIDFKLKGTGASTYTHGS